MKPKTIFLVSTGGTIEKSYCERTGAVSNFGSKIESYVDKIWLPHTRIEVVSVLCKDSRDLTPDDRNSLLTAILARLSFGSPLVITHGTDTILETAKYLEANLPSLSVPIVLTGAMRPLGFENSDGIQNLAESIFAAKILQPGIHLVMHGEVFDIHRARKDVGLGTFVEVNCE
jgi:L-asparaginase